MLADADGRRTAVGQQMPGLRRPIVRGVDCHNDPGPRAGVFYSTTSSATGSETRLGSEIYAPLRDASSDGIENPRGVGFVSLDKGDTLILTPWEVDDEKLSSVHLSKVPSYWIDLHAAAAEEKLTAGSISPFSSDVGLPPCAIVMFRLDAGSQLRLNS